VRRYFYDLIKISGTKNPNKKAIKAVNLIKELYKVDAQAAQKNLSPEELLELRKKKSQKLIDKFEAFVQDNAPKVLPQSYLGKAILYSARQLPRLKHVLKDGIVPLDNNRVENAVRPFAIGRKNWLFAYHADGASASAFFYSIIETAKANGLEPFSYLLHLFENLPFADSRKKIKNLLPMYVDRSKIKTFDGKS